MLGPTDKPEPLLTSVYKTVPLICYDHLKMVFIAVKQISSSFKTHMHVTISMYEKYDNQCLRIYYIRYVNTHGVLRVCMTRKLAVHACRKNLSTLATISWWLFAHFCTRKRAASVGLRHARMNVSDGLCDACTTLSLLSRMFLCCKSRLNISSNSCHWAPWAALRS